MKNNSKSKKKNINPKTIIIATLTILLVSSVIFNGILIKKANNPIDAKKVAIFDYVAFNMINDQSISDNTDESYTMTGYGISSEDDVFYITFEIFDYSECAEDDHFCDGSIKYGVKYYWPTEYGLKYGNAYSYHDSPYHPEGIYRELDYFNN